MSYKFQATLFSALPAMLDAIAEAWLTAGGNNTGEDIEHALSETTDADLASECIEGWGLNLDDGGDYSLPPASHMERHGYGSHDLAWAFGRYRERGTTD